MNHREQSFYNQGRMSGIATVMKRIAEEDFDAPQLIAIMADEMEKAGGDIASLLDIELDAKEAELFDQATFGGEQTPPETLADRIKYLEQRVKDLEFKDRCYREQNSIKGHMP